LCRKKLAGESDHHQPLLREEELNNGIIPISYGLPDKQGESNSQDTSGCKLVFCSAHKAILNGSFMTQFPTHQYFRNSA
jgi:hypothetical protein